MCGIVGFIDPAGRLGPEELQATARQMADTLRHRGPDDAGAWADADAGVALGHRRLSILDLSPCGHQPMASPEGRFVLVYNGEIYNCRPLRHELQRLGHAFRGHSDTEVMLAAIVEWGLPVALERFVGMFAFALWDRQQRRLSLARDRLGEKPLYYGWAGGVFVFGSELKALRAHPRWNGSISREALALFMRHNYIPAPHTIYRDVFKLPSGCWLSLTGPPSAEPARPQPTPYWSLHAAAESGMAHPFDGTADEAVAEMRRVLEQAIAQQMMADVPVGAFLSGGIDSSTIVALMQANSRRPVKTFSIGFDDPKFNEAPCAKAVAELLGTDHAELYFKPGELLEVIPKLPTIYDEPFADTSQIPTVLLCALARRQVTVSLSGDAGDELFGGYAYYKKIEQAWRCFHWIPWRFRARAGEALATLAGPGLASGTAGNSAQLWQRLANLSEVLPARDERSLYHIMMSTCRTPAVWLEDAREPRAKLPPPLPKQPASLLRRLMLWDASSYLPEDILVKVDRAAMAVSLETRIPLLDHRVVEFAWRLPSAMIRRNGASKWVLRQLLYQMVPRALVERPKTGFAAPIAEWLRGPLREWAESLLAPHRLRQEGFFRERIVRQKWTDHLAGRGDWGKPLWNVLTFQAWLQQQPTRSVPAQPIFAPANT